MIIIIIAIITKDWVEQGRKKETILKIVIFWVLHAFDKAHHHQQLIIMTINIKLIQVLLFHTIDTRTHILLLLWLLLLLYMWSYVMKIKNFIISFYSSNFYHFEMRKQETSILHEKTSSHIKMKVKMGNLFNW